MDIECFVSIFSNISWLAFFLIGFNAVIYWDRILFLFFLLSLFLWLINSVLVVAGYYLFNFLSIITVLFIKDNRITIGALFLIFILYLFIIRNWLYCDWYYCHCYYSWIYIFHAIIHIRIIILFLNDWVPIGCCK